MKMLLGLKNYFFDNFKFGIFWKLKIDIYVYIFNLFLCIKGGKVYDVRD